MLYLLYAIAFYALLFVIRYLVVFLQLRKSTLQFPKYRIQNADCVPTYLQQLFQTPIRELEQLGFQPCSYLEVEPMLKLYPPINWELLLYHPSTKTYAKVSIRRPVESANLFDIDFYTWFADESVLLTINGRAYSILGEVPHAIIQDAYTAQTSVQWQVHQDRLKQLTGKTPWYLAPEAFATILQTHTENYINSLIKARSITPIQKTELFQIHWLTALKTTNNIVQGASKAANIIKQRKELAKTDATLQLEIPVELEVEGFQRMEKLRQGLVGNKFRTGLLLGSFGLFVATYTQFFAPQTLVIFIIALLLHEGGHVLAMKFFGYQDTAVLFLPFLGALATSRKDDATLTQKFWVLLAGPLPGLILGIGLAIFTREGNYSSWTQEAGWILIGLNLFNLLPVYPLDGGQIADLLLFSRHLYLGVLFKVFGVILLGLLGLGKPLLLLFAILIALSIPNSYRSAKVHAKLRKQLRQIPPGAQKELLHSLFTHLQQIGSGNLPFNTKYLLVKGLIQHHHESRSNWTTRVFLGILYCGSLLGAIVGSLQAISPHWISLFSYTFEKPEAIRAHITQEQKREVERASEALRVNPNDSKAYLKRAQTSVWLRDYQEALADYNQLVRLNPHDTQYRLARASLRSRLNDNQGAIQDYDYVLRLNPQDTQTYYLRSHLQHQLGNYKEAIADYNQIIKLDSKNLWAYLERGSALQQLHDYKGAITDANTAIQLDPNQPEAYQLRSESRRRLGDRQGAIGDRQKAEALYKAMEEQK